MRIDITADPPTDVLKSKKRYLRISLALLGVVLFAVLLGVIRVVFDSGYDALLENAALVLFVGAGFVFVYFAEKLNEHKPLSKEQQGKVEKLCRQHQEIDRYCRKVAAMNRVLIVAELDAIIAHADAVQARKKRE